MRRRWINVVFAAVVVSFIAATAFVNLKLRAVDHAALGISANTAPSIEHLTDARAELRHLQMLLDSGADVHAVHAAEAALDARVDAYLALPVLPNERAEWAHVLAARSHVGEAIRQFVIEGESRGDTAAAISDLNDALTSSIRGNATHTLAFANEIRAFRERATLLAGVLDVACAFLAIGGALFVRKVMREQEARANELEAFASRVAHDILGPLNTVSFALELTSHPYSEQQRAKLTARGLSAIDRVQKLVRGLLDFARAGGHPEPDARAEVRETIDELVEALQPVARDAHAKLEATTTTDATVACNPGVLTSLVSNLARNAIKYLGDAPERRVEIRAVERAASVRVEVEDTGPGVPKDVRRHLFEPYVRAKGVREPGLGLGLATVKRLADGHGGAVGVDSTPGEGSTFWFELPKAEKVATAV
jgi:signal transduction histidine kinase